jgi:hypothetical protein
MAHQCHDYVLDGTLQLNDRTTGSTVNNTIVGATSGGTAIVLDLGEPATSWTGIEDASPAMPLKKPFARFAVVIDWTGIQAGAGQAYYFKVQGSVWDSAFGSDVFELEQVVVGEQASNNQPFATVANNRKVLYCDNVVHTSTGAAQTCRYIRVAVFCSNGGMTTGWNYKAWLVPLN